MSEERNWDCGKEPGAVTAAQKIYDGIVVVSGNGAMADNKSGGAPWADSKDLILGVTIEDGVTSIGDHAFENCANLVSVKISGSVANIGECAFCRCDSLVSIAIPRGVTEIDRQAFSRCNSLTSIDVAADNPCYCSENGVLFNKNKSTLLRFPSGRQGAYTVSNCVTHIKRDAFAGSGLTSVAIPDSVTYIDNDAFDGCDSLTSVICFNPVPPIIEDRAFGEKSNGGKINSKLTCLYVLPASVHDYREADGWKEFDIKPLW